MRATFLLGEPRRDVGQHPGRGPRRVPRNTVADRALRAGPTPEGFVTSPGQMGRRRLLERIARARGIA